VPCLLFLFFVFFILSFKNDVGQTNLFRKQDFFFFFCFFFFFFFGGGLCGVIFFAPRPPSLQSFWPPCKDPASISPAMSPRPSNAVVPVLCLVIPLLRDPSGTLSSVPNPLAEFLYATSTPTFHRSIQVGKPQSRVPPFTAFCPRTGVESPFFPKFLRSFIGTPFHPKGGI